MNRNFNKFVQRENWEVIGTCDVDKALYRDC